MNRFVLVCLPAFMCMGILCKGRAVAHLRTDRDFCGAANSNHGKILAVVLGGMIKCEEFDAQ